MHISRLRWWLPRIFLAGIVGISVLLLLAPHVPIWGERHEYDVKKGTIRLQPGESIEQTFTAEYQRLDTILFWLQSSTLPRAGRLMLTLSTPSEERTLFADLAAIPPSGTVIFAPTKVVPLKVGQTGLMHLALLDAEQPIYFLYQIDGSLYPDGSITRYTNTNHNGDLAFQQRYQRPALFTSPRQWAYALSLIVAGLVMARVVRIVLQQKISLPARSDIFIGLIVSILITCFYGYYLLQAGTWISPGDFVKDVAYLEASRQAFKQFSWPVWSHTLCGGLPLLGNPESNTLSLALLFTPFLSSQNALLTLLAVEAGLSALGTYLLARAFRLSPPASLIAVIINTLSAAYAYRLAEGFSMIGAAMAFTPWVLLGFWQVIDKKKWWGTLIAGISLAAIFLRGEVHLIVGLIITLVVLTVIASIKKKHWHPVAVLLAVGAIAWLAVAPKLLAYVENPDLFTSNLKPYVVSLTQAGFLDDVFLQTHDRSLKIPVAYSTEEHWGNFGSYTGWLPWVLAAIGLLKPTRYRWFILTGLVTTFLLGEGTLFAWLWPYLGPVGILLRMPTRLFGLLMVFLGLAAASGIQAIGSFFPQKIKLVVATILLISLALNLTHVTSTILADHFSRRSHVTLLSPSQPTLAAHRNESPQHAAHPAIVQKSGYLLPRLCADLNDEPDFASFTEPTLPLTSLPAALQLNQIVIYPTKQTREFTVHERFTSTWIADPGLIIRGPTNALRVILPPDPPSPIRLYYLSGTSLVQQLMVSWLCLTMLGLGYVLIGQPKNDTPAPERDYSSG